MPLLHMLLTTALAGPVPGPAVQERRVTHCVRDDGAPVYTDKPCSAVGARDPREGDAAPAAGPFVSAYRTACIRSLREFTFELSSAIEVGDVNRLATLFRWSGMSTREGYAAMSRLQALAARPLLRIEPVYAAVPAPSLPPAPASASAVPLAAATIAAFPPPAPVARPVAPPPGTTSPPAAPPAATPARKRPVALRLDQVLPDGVTPAPTTLPLQRELGCWWLGP